MTIIKIIKLAAVLIIFPVIVDAYSVKKVEPLIVQPIIKLAETFSPPRLTPSPEPEPPRTTLIFTGDITLGRCVASTTIRSGDYTYPFQFVAEKLNSADITVGSLDGSISNASPPQDCPGSMNLIGPENMVQGLKHAGFDVITVATNHIKDCGEKGFSCNDKSFFDTIHSLERANILPVGGGENLREARKPVVVEKNGIRFAFLSINQINNFVWATDHEAGVTPLLPESMEQIKTDIAVAKTNADVVIILPQWGVEYSSHPEAIQRQWAQEFINAGATLVIGNGPHIVQPMETFSNGTAFYALGNFVFDQAQNSRREGIVVKATFLGTQLENIELLPVDINYYTYQPQWTEGADMQKILTRIPDLSH